MEIVIKISEKVYEALAHTEFDASLVVNEMRKSIANGTPLPKSHGRLIDASYKVSSDGRTIDTVCGYIAPTIIYGTNNHRSR